MVFFFLQINDEEEGSDTGCYKARGRGPFGDEEEGFRKGITQTHSFSIRFVQKKRSSNRTFFQYVNRKSFKSVCIWLNLAEIGSMPF
jgi:hypothetical protein